MRKLSVKRFVLAALAVFVAFFVMEMLVHGVLLQSLYEPLMTGLKGWRSEAQMQQPRYIAAGLGGTAVYALLFVWMFHCGWQGRKWEGLRYGLYAWGFTMLPWMLWWYAMQPIGMLVPWWLGVSFVELLILGLIAAAIYRPRE